MMRSLSWRERGVRWAGVECIGEGRLHGKATENFGMVF